MDRLYDEYARHCFTVTKLTVKCFRQMGFVFQSCQEVPAT